MSDVSWSKGSDQVVSCGYDQTCKIWDTEQGKMLESFDVEGFVQCVKFSPNDNNVFFCGTSRNVLGIYDRRDPSVQMTIRNNSMVNSVAVASNESTAIVSGDGSGFLKTWDIRTGKMLNSHLNETTNKPISHISMLSSTETDEYKLLAVNSYENVMRVYERTLSSNNLSYKLMHALKGYKNRNWPIRSSFYYNKEGIFTLKIGITFLNKNSGSSDDIYGKDLPQEDENIYDRHKCETMALLATGSADPYIYIYSLGHSEVI